MIDKNKKGLISVINQSFMDLSDSWHRIVSMSTVSVESWSLQIKHQFFIILTGYMSCSLLLSRKFSQYRQILYKKKNAENTSGYSKRDLFRRAAFCQFTDKLYYMSPSSFLSLPNFLQRQFKCMTSAVSCIFFLTFG